MHIRGAGQRAESCAFSSAGRLDGSFVRVSSVKTCGRSPRGRGSAKTRRRRVFRSRNVRDHAPTMETVHVCRIVSVRGRGLPACKGTVTDRCVCSGYIRPNAAAGIYFQFSLVRYGAHAMCSFLNLSLYEITKNGTNNYKP
jgi:hypothetical protein